MCHAEVVVVVDPPNYAPLGALGGGTSGQNLVGYVGCRGMLTGEREGTSSLERKLEIGRDAKPKPHIRIASVDAL
jgi:hypothetical protein